MDADTGVEQLGYRQELKRSLSLADLLVYGLVFATIMGFLGGLLPAFRGARLPITSALREA